LWQLVGFSASFSLGKYRGDAWRNLLTAASSKARAAIHFLFGSFRRTLSQNEDAPIIFAISIANRVAVTGFAATRRVQKSPASRHPICPEKQKR